MNRPLLLLTCALAPLAACAPGYMPGGGPYDGGPYDDRYDERYDDRYERGGAPLRARLFDDATGLSVQLNHTAHVAIFEIVPGRGVGLMYPSSYGDRPYVQAGYNRMYTGSVRPYTWYYHDDPVAYRQDGPRYYLLVASRRPLYIDRYRNAPGQLRRDLGLHRFATFNSGPLMDELVSAVLPPQPDGDWDTDLLTLWPREVRNRGYNRWYGDDRLVTVRCRDGTFVTTYLYDVSRVCALRGNGTPPPRNPETPRDSVRIPTRRRPEPSTPQQTDGEKSNRPPGRARIETWINREEGENGTGGNPRVEPRRPEPSSSEERPEPRRREQPRAEPRVEPRVENQPAPRAEPREEPRPAPRVERPESRPQPRVERQPEHRSESRPEPRPEPRSEPRPEPRPEPRVERQPERRAEPRVERPAPPAESRRRDP